MSEMQKFILESNRIEGIHREPSRKEMDEYQRFMALDSITLADMRKFVNVYQPGAKLRDKKNMDVRVGSYFPPLGGPSIKRELEKILESAWLGRHSPGAAYRIHQQYEKLHPFMDGNGRSGRMLWRWMMPSAPLGFLHTWYYQSLQYGGDRG